MVGSWMIWFRISISRAGSSAGDSEPSSRTLAPIRLAATVRADIDRIEEAVAGGVGDDGEGQVRRRPSGSPWCPGLLRGVLEVYPPTALSTPPDCA